MSRKPNPRRKWCVVIGSRVWRGLARTKGHAIRLAVRVFIREGRIDRQPATMPDGTFRGVSAWIPGE